MDARSFIKGQRVRWLKNGMIGTFNSYHTSTDPVLANRAFVKWDVDGLTASVPFDALELIPAPNVTEMQKLWAALAALTERVATLEPPTPAPAKAVAPKLTAWQRHLLLLLLTTKSLIVSGGQIHYEQQNGLNLYEDIPQQELQDLGNAGYVTRDIGCSLQITDLGRAALESAK